MGDAYTSELAPGDGFRKNLDDDGREKRTGNIYIYKLYFM